MSRNQRLALVGAAIVVAVVAFVIASSGSDDSGDKTNTTAASTTPADDNGGGTSQPQGPSVERIVIKGTEVQGGARNINVKKGDKVHIVVTADAPNTIHLHGYNIERDASPSKPANFEFTADIEGVFEIESHTFEDAGRPPVIGKLVVEPS